MQIELIDSYSPDEPWEVTESRMAQLRKLIEEYDAKFAAMEQRIEELCQDLADSNNDYYDLSLHYMTLKKRCEKAGIPTNYSGGPEDE